MDFVKINFKKYFHKKVFQRKVKSSIKLEMSRKNSDNLTSIKLPQITISK